MEYAVTGPGAVSTELQICESRQLKYRSRNRNVGQR